MKPALFAAAALALAAGGAGAQSADPEAFPSTYEPLSAPPVLITGVTVLDGAGNRHDNGAVAFENGRVVYAGPATGAPDWSGRDDAQRVDGQGRWVTPGLIDVHSHLGVYPSPGITAHEDGNE
ncbi:MAG: amidohydrolase, partial [Xanthomonadales bacterium]|nr:amidohydrolase [Xanthomonadales bacterium]